MYSRNGTASGKLVYAHYGTSKDYKALEKAGLKLDGHIVLVRIGGGISVASKVLLAAKFGASAILTYK
jgi:hypothetical protein